MVLLGSANLLKLMKEEKLVIMPFDGKSMESAYIKLKLGGKFSTLMPINKEFIDPTVRKTPLKQREFLDTEPALVAKRKYTIFNIQEGETYMLEPGEFVLGMTKEYIKLPFGYIGMLHGTSSLGRLGVQVFCSGGFVDPGFEGHALLEIFNANRIAIILRPGMTIAKLAIQELSGTLKDEKKDTSFYGENGISKLTSWVEERMSSD